MKTRHKTVEKTETKPPARLRRVLRKPEVVRAVGYSSVQIDFLVADKKFPKPFKLSKGGKAVGWFEDEIIAYQQERDAERNADQS